MEVTPKSRSTWHDAEVPTLRAQTPGHNAKVHTFGRFFGRAPDAEDPRYGSRAWSLCAQLEGCASRYKRLRASVSTGLRSTTKVIRRDTFYSGQCNVMQT